MHIDWWSRSTLAVVVCVWLAGCDAHGLDLPSAAAGPTSQETTTVTPPPERPASDSTVVFSDNPSIVDSHPLAFDSWSRLGAGDAIRVYFTMGSPDCYGVHASVRETADTVSVELRSGSLPEAAGRACIMIAVFGALDVPLQNPLGDRKVLQ